MKLRDWSASRSNTSCHTKAQSRITTNKNCRDSSSCGNSPKDISSCGIARHDKRVASCLLMETRAQGDWEMCSVQLLQQACTHLADSIRQWPGSNHRYKNKSNYTQNLHICLFQFSCEICFVDIVHPGRSVRPTVYFRNRLWRTLLKW